MNRALLVPLVSFLLLRAQDLFGIQVTDELVQMVSDAILSVAVVIGFFMNPKKKKDE